MSTKTTVFFGAGEMGRLSLGYAATRQIEVHCVIDNNPKRWGATLKGTKICSPDYLKEIKAEEVVVTVGPKDQSDIIAQLTEMGYTYGKDLFTFQDKFYQATVPSISEPGYLDMGEEFSLLKPITDCYLITDKSRKIIYRAIREDKAETMRTVYERVSGSEHLSKLVVPTTISENSHFDNISPLVFQHQYLSPLSFPFEWSPVMLKDYVLFMIELILQLDKANLGLADPSAYNATFYNGDFLFIDYSGIYCEKTNLFTLKSFIELLINPLVLIVKCPAKGYLYLRNLGILLKWEDIQGYLNDKEQSEYLKMQDKCFDAIQKQDVEEVCKLLKEYIEAITEQLLSVTDWEGYQDKLFKTTNDTTQWTAKQQSVIDLIRKTGSKNLLDLAGNMGWYSIAISKELDYAITADIDAGMTNFAYSMVKKCNIKNVWPVCFNLISPPPAVYRGSYLYTDTVRPHIMGALERFRCDTVLALAVEHHLALSQGLSFDEIIGIFALYTNKYLIIEFVDRDDEWVIPHLKRNDSFRTEWYTKARFEEAIKRKFNIITTAPSEVETRTIYLCEKR